MAGFFGLFNYDKEGPGIEKNAPKKKTFVVFFETFFRNFWKFIPLNLVYNLLSILVVTNGLANAGLTNVTRNIARDKHSFGLSDFWDTVKKNYRQAIPVGIINVLVYIIIVFDIWFFNSSEAVWAKLGTSFGISIFFIFTVMQYYIWTLMITFKFNIKTLYMNSLRFAFVNLKNNVICFFSLALVYGANIGILFLLKQHWIIVITLEIMAYIALFPAFKLLMVQYCVFPAIKKHIIDPYYEAHPDDDIQLRKDLGLEIKSEVEGVDAEEDTDTENEIGEKEA